MPNEHYYLSLERNADVKAVPGMLIYAFRALLLFTNYEDFSRDLLSRIDEAEYHPDGSSVLVSGVLVHRDHQNAKAPIARIFLLIVGGACALSSRRLPSQQPDGRGLGYGFAA
jgi:hypothetical protein